MNRFAEKRWYLYDNTWGNVQRKRDSSFVAPFDCPVRLRSGLKANSGQAWLAD